MSAAENRKNKPPTFEEAVHQLEAIIEKIEAGEVGLEESLTQYEQGIRLVNHCRKVLDSAEKKIQELTLEPGGGLRPTETQIEEEQQG